jgi:beta-lactamase regulating signal transducer with metallopeptidase domain
MIAYLLKSATCLALLLAFYHLVLEREKMHNFNRFYLLGSVLFSFLVPLYIIYVDANPIVFETIQTTTSLQTNEVISSNFIVEKSFDYTSIFIVIYCLISSVLLIRFGRNFINIISKINKNEKINYQKAVLVLVDDKILPHTFWNYIFINKNDYENKKIEQELFTHELTHVTQKHTLDIILLELTQALFWINPFFILLKKAVQLNHEFLADEKVINEHKNTFQYQHLLLNKAAWKNEYYLASNLNYSLTKKRLKMMTTQSSPTKILLKKLAVVPLLTGFIFLFAERVEAQEIKEFNQQALNEEVLDAYKEYGYRNRYVYTKDEKDNTIRVPYSILSEKKKKKIHPASPINIEKKTVSKKFLENLKKNRLHNIIFIDGILIQQDELKKYKASDFSYYTAIYKHFNEKLNRYIKHNNLETNQYFKQKNKKRGNNFLKYLQKEKKININEASVKKIMTDYSKSYSIDSYIHYYKRYNSIRNQYPDFVKKSNEKREFLISSFTFLTKQYSKLSIEDQNKVKKPLTPYYPYTKVVKNDKVFYKLGKELIEEEKIVTEKKNEKTELDKSNLPEFNIQIEKIGSTFQLKCTKGCEWTDLTFKLDKNKSQTVDQFGIGNSKDYSSDFKIFIKNIEDDLTGHKFSVGSLKGTYWLNGETKYSKNKGEVNETRN